MKRLFFIASLMMIFFSCSKNYYGTYNTNFSKDKSAFFQIKLNVDHTVEKTEIHTISDFAQGRFMVTGHQVVCFLDSSRNKFPPDTLTFKIKGKKLYFLKNGILNKKAYLTKE